MNFSQISKIEEEIQRSRNEYGRLVAQLEQLRMNLVPLNSIQPEAQKDEERKKLEDEEQSLIQKLARRHSIFQGEKSQ